MCCQVQESILLQQSKPQEVCLPTCTAMMAATGEAGARKPAAAVAGSDPGVLTAIAFSAACTRAPAATDLADSCWNLASASAAVDGIPLAGLVCWLPSAMLVSAREASSPRRVFVESAEVLPGPLPRSAAATSADRADSAASCAAQSAALRERHATDQCCAAALPCCNVY